jgi:O-antigen/teichoic acid export membrane protein
MVNKEKGLLSITLLNAMAKMVFFVFVFLTSYITSRALSKAEFGELQYTMLWVNIGWVLFNFGVPNILSRFFTQAFAQQSFEAIHRLITIAMRIGSVTIVLTILLVFGVQSQTGLDIPFWVVIVLILTTISLFYLQILVQALFAFKALLLVNIVSCTSALSFLVYMLPIQGGIAFLYTYIIANGILSLGYLVILISGIKRLNRQPSTYQLPTNQTLIKTAVYFGGSAILAGILQQRYELSLLKYTLLFDELATYMIAFSVLALVMEPLKLIPSVLIYYFAGIGGNHSLAAAKFASFFKHFVWLVFFVGFFTFFNAEEIVTIIYTRKYRESVYLLKILLVGMIPGTCSYVMMNMHVGLGRSRFLLTQDLIGVLVFCVLLFLGNSYFGLAGAAWAKSIAVMISVGLGLWYTSQHLRYNVPYVSILWSGITSIALCWLTQTILIENVFLLFIKGILLFTLYTGISWLLKTIDRELFRNTINRFGMRLRGFFQL